MSLERVDARTKLDHDVHAALVAICEIDGVTIAEFIERLLVPVVEDRLVKARLLVKCTERIKLNRESRVFSASDRE